MEKKKRKGTHCRIYMAFSAQAHHYGWPITEERLQVFAEQVRKGLRVAPTYEYAFMAKAKRAWLEQINPEEAV